MPTRDELRKQCLTDKLALARLLGYDFVPEVHGDLFKQYITFDNSKSYFDQDHQKHRLILWSRGFYKTTSTIVEIVQTILNFPEVSLMLMQSTKPKSQELLGEVKKHFTGENQRSKLGSLFPEFCREKLGTVNSFTVPTRKQSRIAPTVFVASPKSSKAGWHPDAGYFDDLVTELNYKSPDAMKKVIEEFSHYTPLVNPGGYFYVTGTRYTFGDLYEHIIRNNLPTEEFPQGKWKVSIKGCWRVNPDGSKTSNFPLSRKANGDPIGLSIEMLEAIQRDNPETFHAQYLNQPIAGDRQLFTEQLLMGAVIPKEQVGAVGPAILFVDLASATTITADKSVVVCGRQIGRKAVVCDINGGQWSTLQIAHAILEMCLKHRPLKVFIEGTPASTYFIDYLKVIGKDKNFAVPVEALKVSNNKGAKFLRIGAVEGAIKTGRLGFLVGLPGWTELVQQFCEFPKGRHDDEIDTIGMLVQYYSNQTAAYDPFPTARLPFFLLQPGKDFSLESQIVRPEDAEAQILIPEASF
jgi:hypothetical protein